MIQQPVARARRLSLLRRWTAAVLGLALVGLYPAPGAGDPAGTPHLPDFSTEIPLTSFSIVDVGGGKKEFRYTHWVYNRGAGPLQIQPEYSEASGTYRGVQQFYTHNSSGQWEMTGTRRVPDAFEFHAEHGHFHYPLATFGLYADTAGGDPGAPVSLSPKTGFCIADSFINPDATMAHRGEIAASTGSCSDPTSMRGMSVGGVDEYDYRDDGQAIPFNGIADGVYWFKGMTDPYNDIVESDESNNERDVRVRVTGASVTVLETRTPDTTPPSLSLTSPSNGTVVDGSVSLSATAGAGQHVEFLVDGESVGSAPQAAAPYSVAWDTTKVTDGEHWVSARTTNAQGRSNSSAVASVIVANVSPPPPTDGLTLDASRSQDGTTGTVTTPALTNVPSGELLVAQVSADGPQDQAQTATVTGGGLTWTRRARANGQPGTSEIWTAVTPASLPSVPVTSTLTYPNLHQALHVAAFSGSDGAGAAETASGTTGAPLVSVTTTTPGSWVFSVGNDWDGATARELRFGQVMGHQWVDTAVGDTFWMQHSSAPTPAAGTEVNAGTLAPPSGRWNMAAVEVLPGADTPPPPEDTTPPSVELTAPAPDATLGGITNVAATAQDNVGVAGVAFTLDGAPLGALDSSPPFMVPWDTRTATAGSHTLVATARDAAGNTTASTPVTVTVDNSGPSPAAIGQDAWVSRDGTGTLTATGLTTATAGEQLVAFVGMDGPAGATSQRATVSGGGLTWRLVKRSDTQTGVAEIWTARAASALTDATVTATPLVAGRSGMLHVVAFRNVAGPGVAAATAAPSGAPDIYVPGVHAGSWVYAVGTAPDEAVARKPVAGQQVVHERVDSAAGATYWVQRTATPNTALGLVTIHDDQTVTDTQWSYAAVELVAAETSTPVATGLTATASRTATTWGRAVTLSTRLTSAGAGVPGERVRLEARPYGGPWAPLLTRVLDGAGRASASVAPRRNTAYRWRFEGAPTRLASLSAVRTVSVASKVTARLADATVARGRTLVVTGRTYPAHPGDRVTLVRRTSTGARTVATARAAPDGTYRLSWRPASAGARRLAVRIGAVDGNAAGASDWLYARVG